MTIMALMICVLQVGGSNLVCDTNYLERGCCGFSQSLQECASFSS